MYWVRALLVWLVLMAVETVHGTLRAMLLVPLAGDFRSRQIGVVVGSVLIAAVVCLLARWIDGRTKARLLAVGCLWAGLTLAFELVLGRWAFRYSWEKIASDFDLGRGGLMALGLLVLALSPMLTARLRRLPPFAGASGEITHPPPAPGRRDAGERPGG